MQFLLVNIEFFYAVKVAHSHSIFLRLPEYDPGADGIDTEAAHELLGAANRVMEHKNATAQNAVRSARLLTKQFIEALRIK